MKDKIKIYGMVLLCLLSLSIGCSKDDYQLEQQQRFPGSKVSFEQFKQETGLRDFKTSIQVKRKKNGALNRNADGSYELSDFDIDTDVIKRLEYKNDVTYTFRVTPKEPEYEKIFNLTMYNKDGNWETMIVELKPTEQDLEKMKLGQVDSFEGTVDLTYNSNKMCAFISILFLHCTKTGPCEKGPCDRCNECISSDSYTTCGVAEHELPVRLPSVLDSDGTGGGVGPGTDTGTTTTDTDQTLVVPPKKPVVIDPFLEYTPPPKTPCDELAKLNSNNSIQLTLRILKPQASGESEHGNYMSVTTNSVGSTYLSFPVIPPDPENPAKLNMDAGIANGNIKGAMHCHTDPVSTNAVPMFSPADLKSLFNIARNHNTNGNPKDYSEYTVILSVSSGHYALKFKDFDTFLLNYNANFTKFDKDLRDLYRASTPTASSTLLIKNFLETLKKYNFDGMGLYKATETTGTDGIVSITGWNEQALNAAGNVFEIPCN